MRRNKYNAKKTMVDDIIFDSEMEAGRYKVLKLFERAGEIKDLRLQVPFVFLLNGKKIFTYYADFLYLELQRGKKIDGFVLVIEDVKGQPTAVYRLKKKLIEAQYGIKITEYPGKGAIKKKDTFVDIGTEKNL